jgi:O-antigen ligase
MTSPAPALVLDRAARALLVAVVGLAPLLVLRGQYDAANLPQAAFIQVGLLLCALLWAMAGAAGGRADLRIGVFAGPVLSLVACAALSQAWAANRQETRLAVAHAATCALAYVLVCDLVREAGGMRRLLATLFASGVVVAGVGLAQALGGFSWLPQSAPPAATFVNKNMAAQFVVGVLPLGAGLALAAGTRARVLLGAGGLALLAYLFFSFTRSAWLAAAVQAAVLAAWMAREKRRALFIGLAAAGVALMAALPLARSAPARRAAAHAAAALDPTADAPGSLSVRTRLAVWRNSAAMFADAPVLGVGLGNHRVQYPRYARAAAVDPLFGPERQLDYAHNDLVQLGAELGLAGLGLAAWLGVSLLGAARGVWRQRASVDTAPLAVAALAGLLGLAVDALFSFPFQRAVPGLVAAVCLGVVAGAVTPRVVSATRGAWLAVGASAALLLALAGARQARALAADRHLLLALRAERAGQWSAAEQHAREALRHRPSREAFFVVGASRLARGDAPGAVAPLEWVLASYPHDLATLGNLAAANAAGGDPARAAILVDRMRAIAPDDPALLARQAAVFERQGLAAIRAGRHAEARAALEQAIGLDPGRSDSHKALGVLLFEVLGQPQAGAEHLRRALELRPQDRDAPRMRALLARARLQPPARG